MFTCAKIKNGRTYLGGHLTANDYYTEKEHVSGKWVGLAAERLNLADQPIDAGNKAFEALRNNLRPDGSGKGLTPSRDEKGVRFFDFQCSAQKSVSVMAVVMDDKRLYAAHDRAATAAFAELERFAGFRSGKLRKIEPSGNLCAAMFRHDASRALDPQMHTHFVVANATYDEKSSRWLSLDTHDIFKAVQYAGRFYQNELALECRRLGYEIEHVRNDKGVIDGFEIKGVSKEIRERYSKRRSEIELGIERFEQEKGRRPTTKEVGVITRETRGVKMIEIATAEVRNRQRNQLSEGELATLKAIKDRALVAAVERIKTGASLTMCNVKENLQQASEHIFERKSVIKGHEIMAVAMRDNAGYIDTDELRQRMTSKNSGMIELTKSSKNPIVSSQWTSEGGFRWERESIAFVSQTQNQHYSLGKIEGVDFDFKSEEQRRVVVETLNNRDRVYEIRGRAGTGKTTALKEIHKGLEAASRNGIYLAPTAAAVKVLQNDGFESAMTVDSFLAKKVTGLTHNDVVIVDEASLLSMKKGKALLNAARNARIVLIGDTHQHVSVEAGDFLRVLEQHSRIHYSELKDIQRQQTEEYNRAVRMLSDGRIAEGMKKIDNLGWIQEGKSEYIEQAAEAYFEDTENGTKLEQCIAISPTWNENHRFTDAIRQGLKDRQLLSEKGTLLTVCNPLDWTEEQKKTIGNYRPGMLVTFHPDKKSVLGGKTLEIDQVENGQIWLKGYNRYIDEARLKQTNKYSVSLPRTIELTEGDKILMRQNRKDVGLINGNIFTVDKINADGSIATREGQNIPVEYRHFCHGYVVTSHKSQGETKARTVIAAETLDSKSSYVSFSRSREQARLFTLDKETLYGKLGIPTDRPAAVDVINEHRKAFWERERIKAHKQTMLAIELHIRTENEKRFNQEIAPEQPETETELETPELQIEMLKQLEIEKPKQPEMRPETVKVPTPMSEQSEVPKQPEIAKVPIPIRKQPEAPEQPKYDGGMNM